MLSHVPTGLLSFSKASLIELNVVCARVYALSLRTKQLDQCRLFATANYSIDRSYLSLQWYTFDTDKQ